MLSRSGISSPDASRVNPDSSAASSRVRPGDPALDQVQGLLLPGAKTHRWSLRSVTASGRVTASWPGDT